MAITSKLRNQTQPVFLDESYLVPKGWYLRITAKRVESLEDGEVFELAKSLDQRTRDHFRTFQQ